MEIAVAVAVGSSIQIAVGVIPALVIVSWAIGQPLTVSILLAFRTFGLARLPLPASYSDGFEQCVGDIAEYPGIYGASTYYQDEEGDDAPPPHDAPASSNCNPQPSPSNGVTAPGSSSTSASSAAATPAPGASSSVLPPQSGAQTTGGSRSNSAASSNHKLSSSSVLVRFSAGVAGLAALSVLLA
ncbi:unnamed protein product [Tilletia controversa]|nr:unnamed protein product [Tilletia controversa]